MLYVQKLEACTFICFECLDALNHRCFNMGQSTLHVHFDFGMCDTAIEVQGHLITQKILINNNEMAKPRR